MIRWNDRSIKFNNASSIHDSTFIYRVGDFVEPKNGFNRNFDESCSSGIHYFLKEEPAKFWKYKPVNGQRKSWYDNGRINEVFSYTNGYLNGICISYYENGNIESEYTYKDGVKSRAYKTYYINGRIREESTYNYYKSYYVNGRICVELKLDE